MQGISQSVGQGGVNLSHDVKQVQTLLNLVPVAHGGTNIKLKVDGIAGAKTIAAIRAFQQRTNCPVIDGRIAPSKGTEAKLMSYSRDAVDGTDGVVLKIGQILAGSTNFRLSGWKFNSGAGGSMGIGPIGYSYNTFTAEKKGTDADVTAVNIDYTQPGDLGDRPISYYSMGIGVGAGIVDLCISLDISNSALDKPSWIMKTTIPQGKPLTGDDLLGLSITLQGTFNWIPGVAGGGRSGALIFFGLHPTAASLISPIASAIAAMTAGIGVPVALAGNLRALVGSSKCMCFSIGSQSGIPLGGVGISGANVSSII